MQDYFCGLCPEHLWQDDVEDCEQLVKDDWASKFKSQRFVVILCPPTHAHVRLSRALESLSCLSTPTMPAKLQAAVQLYTVH